MKQVNFSNTLASEMDKVLNSPENKSLFSSSSVLEKLAFKKVSEEDQVSEVEMELDPSLKKTASASKFLYEHNFDDNSGMAFVIAEVGGKVGLYIVGYGTCEECDASEEEMEAIKKGKQDPIASVPAGPSAPERLKSEFERVVDPSHYRYDDMLKCLNDWAKEGGDEKKSEASILDTFNTLLKVSESLDNAGFEKLAATSALLAERLMVEAKAKAKAKSKGKSSKEPAKSSEKSKSSDKDSKTSKDKSSKKMSVKERMKKMRDMKKSKDSKKSSKSSDVKKK